MSCFLLSECVYIRVCMWVRGTHSAESAGSVNMIALHGTMCHANTMLCMHMTHRLGLPMEIVLFVHLKELFWVNIICDVTEQLYMQIVRISKILFLKGGNFHLISCSTTICVASHHHQFVAREDCYQRVRSCSGHVADDLPGVGCWVVLVNGSRAVFKIVITPTDC